MKTLNNLGINPEKMLKNDELSALRGGVLCPPESPFPCFCPGGGATYFCGCQGDREACNVRCGLT